MKIGDWRKLLEEDERRALKQRPIPRWTRPILVTLTEKRFSAPDWIYERKLDGERCRVFRRKTRVHIPSRNRRRFTIASCYHPG